MFITKEQLEKRLSSPNNVINIIEKSNPKSLSPADSSVPDQEHPVIENNLPGESNKQRAARVARTNIDQYEKHGEYQVNPNIDNDIVRATIGALAATGSASIKEISEEFGVTENQIKGARDSKNEDIKKRIETAKNKVSEIALDRLMLSLGLMTPEVLTNTKPKDLSVVMANLSSVVSRMKSEESEKAASINLNVYVPETKQLENYSVIDV